MDKFIGIHLLLMLVLYSISMITLAIHLTKYDNMVKPSLYSRTSSFCFIFFGVLSISFGKDSYESGFRFGYSLLDSSKYVTGFIFSFIALCFGLFSIRLIRYRFRAPKRRSP